MFERISLIWPIPASELNMSGQASPDDPVPFAADAP